MNWNIGFLRCGPSMDRSEWQYAYLRQQVPRRTQWEYRKWPEDADLPCFKGNTNQLFTVTGDKRITWTNKGKCPDLTDGHTAPGTRIQDSNVEVHRQQLEPRLELYLERLDGVENESVRKLQNTPWGIDY